MHFDGALDRVEDQFSQGGRASVPEEGFFPSEIKEWHGIPSSEGPGGTLTETTRIGEGVGGLVA